MGHTVTSQRQMIDMVLADLKHFGGALRKQDRLALERMLKEPLKHTGAISNAGSIDIWAMLLLSILVEQDKRLSALEAAYDRLVDRRLPQ